MPVKSKKIAGKWRVVEVSTGKLCKTRTGTPCDGGGHGSKGEADRQAAAINIREKK